MIVGQTYIVGWVPTGIRQEIGDGYAVSILRGDLKVIFGWRTRENGFGVRNEGPVKNRGASHCVSLAFFSRWRLICRVFVFELSGHGSQSMGAQHAFSDLEGMRLALVRAAVEPFHSLVFTLAL